MVLALAAVPLFLIGCGGAGGVQGKGTCVSGNCAGGQCQLVWPQTKDVYIGECKDRLPHGTGKGNSNGPPGSIYIGGYVDGWEHGKGIKKYKSGRVYSGDWDMGRRTGQGTEVAPNGNSYQGRWRSGKQHGQGKVVRPDGSYFTGTWNEGRIDEGSVIQYDANGNKVGRGCQTFNCPFNMKK